MYSTRRSPCEDLLRRAQFPREQTFDTDEKLMEESEHTTSLLKRNLRTSAGSSILKTLFRKKMSELEKKRRFTDEQIRALEFMFESDEKLEPRKKLQLAREIGLQPRQIAIWFQNRRARWKAKRIEQDYRKLKVDYDTLLSRFESLKKENESLQDEFERLRDMTGRSHGAVRENELVIKGNDLRGLRIVDGEKLIISEAGKKASCSNMGLDDMWGLHLLDEKKSNSSYLDNKNGTSTSTDKWYSVDPCGLLDQSCSNSHWLDIWT